jgi:hypothetical protein
MAKNVNIDLGFDVYDGKSALKAYSQLVNQSDQIITTSYYGNEITIDAFLRTPGFPEYGFSKGILPSHIFNVSTTFDETEGTLISLSYNGQLNHASEQKYWESTGYQTKQHKKSMQVLDQEGKLLASYGKKRILIKKERLDEFIEAMQE